MAELKIKKDGPDLFSFQLQWKEDGKVRKQAISFNKDGEATKALSKSLYALGWAVTGDPGDKFSFEVTLADKSIAKKSGKLTDARRAVGGAVRVEV